MSATASGNPLSHRCPQCGSTHLRESLVKSAIWHADRLVIVEDIPAIVCGDCGERFYDDATATMLDLMHGEGYPAAQAVQHVSVPIFRFAQRVPPELLETAETET